MNNLIRLTIKEVKPYNFKFLLSYVLIRYKVFIKEFKRKAFEEFSTIDITANHYVFLKGKKAIGIARVIRKGNCVEFGRIAVIKEYRNQGNGKKFIEIMISNIKNENKAKLISLFVADISLINFYSQHGFLENGETYFDMIPYVNMIKYL